METIDRRAESSHHFSSLVLVGHFSLCRLRRGVGSWQHLRPLFHHVGSSSSPLPKLWQPNDYVSQYYQMFPKGELCKVLALVFVTTISTTSHHKNKGHSPSV